jgi:hypothetical protein
VAVIPQHGSEIFTVTDYYPDENVKNYKTYRNEINAHVTIIVSYVHIRNVAFEICLKMS